MILKGIAVLAMAAGTVVFPVTHHQPVHHAPTVSCETVDFNIKPKVGHPADYELHLCGRGMPQDSALCPVSGQLPAPGARVACSVTKEGK